ncbi:hypothetical protein [Microcoleus asticus]|uniref:hypothetical protein n=1 Tax=Microcoleus asticus TaxID=2815231 RepID=UPI001551C7A9|nr:hypothetical protein [Microcoleus asticus]
MVQDVRSKELFGEKSGVKLRGLSASESSIDKVEGKIRARVKQTHSAAEPSTMALCLRKK